MLRKVLSQASDHIFFCFAVQYSVLQGKQCRSLHRVQNLGLEHAFRSKEFLLDICFGVSNHLLIPRCISSGRCGHIPHHACVDHPVRSTQIVPVVYGFGQRTVFTERSATATFERLIAQPVSPLVVEVFVDQRVVIVFRIVDVVHELVHRFPALVDDLGVAELFPNRPRNDDSGVGPS